MNSATALQQYRLRRSRSKAKGLFFHAFYAWLGFGSAA
jgi:hypothetical protein